MRRRLMIIATVFAVLALLTCGGWWVWREYYSADLVRVSKDKNYRKIYIDQLILDVKRETNIWTEDWVDDGTFRNVLKNWRSA